MDDTKLDEMYNMVTEIYRHLYNGPQAKRSDAEKHKIAMDVLSRALKRQEKRKRAA